MDEVKVNFVVEKETPGTIRFKEANVFPGDKPILGTLYVPKPTLKQLGWQAEQGITVTIEIT